MILAYFSRSNLTSVRFALMAQTRKEMMANIIRAFEEYPVDKLADKYACYYNNLFSIMSSLVGNDNKQAQNDGKKRRRETGTSVDLFINLDDYDNCLAYIAE
jgi:predicted transcriptional regulator